MQIHLLYKGHTPKRLETADRLPDKGYLWLDFRREHANDWPEQVKRLTGVTPQDTHVVDSLGEGQPSYFDGTPDYDMLIFLGLGPDEAKVTVDTRTAAFFVFDRLLVTVRASDNLSFNICKDRYEQQRLKSPEEPVGLMLQILDIMVDRYLSLRGRLTERVNRLEEDLLDPDSLFEDWRQLLGQRRQTRKLEIIFNDQLEALDSWRRGTRLHLTRAQALAFQDVRDHINRVLTHVESQQRDIESAVQLHFSSVAHRTNRIIKTLTILSAVFLPLTFIVGIYGMNFEHMPELSWHYGYYLIMAGMALFAGVMLLIFKRRGYF
jgi:magnesium transporter